MENERQSMPIVVTRNDLYRQVWSTPLVQLAARYETATAELTTMCTRMNVPRPPSGYWLKKIKRQAFDSDELPPADQSGQRSSIDTDSSDVCGARADVST